MVDDWIDHTPRDILTKNFGVDHKVFNSVHSNFPYILNGTVSKDLDKAPVGTLRGDDSYVDNTYKHPSEPVPGRLPSRLRNDSTSIRVTLVPLSLLVTPRLARLTPKRWTPLLSPAIKGKDIQEQQDK
jgi:oxalate decarboxylase